MQILNTCVPDDILASAFTAVAYEDLTFDLPNFRVACNGQPLGLSMREYKVLLFLVGRADGSRRKLVPKKTIIVHLYGDDPRRSNCLNMFIFRIRGKIRSAKSVLDIGTIRGKGCRLVRADTIPPRSF